VWYLCCLRCGMVDLRPRGLRRSSAAARQGHGYVSLLCIVCCPVKVSASGWSLAHRSCIECGVFDCDHEARKGTFRWDIPVVLYRIIECKQNTVKQNSMILLRCILTLFLSTTYFGSSYGSSSGWLLFLNKVEYTINSAIVIVTYEISYSIYKNSK
jgi:hypothetical protein